MVIDTSALLAAADITTVPLEETHVHWALVPTTEHPSSIDAH